MGNHQTNSKRQHRPSECVGFNNKTDSDDERLVTIQKREKRVRFYLKNIN